MPSHVVGLSRMRELMNQPAGAQVVDVDGVGNKTGNGQPIPVRCERQVPGRDSGFDALQIVACGQVVDSYLARVAADRQLLAVGAETNGTVADFEGTTLKDRRTLPPVPDDHFPR